MKPEIKKLWVDALRSGEYKQTSDALRTGDNFCCLGVLCDLHAKETGGKWEGWHYGGNQHTPPPDVVEWAGLDDQYGGEVVIAVEMRDVQLAITEHNDSGRTFAEIANAIEEQL